MYDTPVKVTVTIEFGDHRSVTTTGSASSSVGQGEYVRHAPRVARSLAVEAARDAADALGGYTGDIDAEVAPEALKRLRLDEMEQYALANLAGRGGRAKADDLPEALQHTLADGLVALHLVRRDFGYSSAALFFQITEKGIAWLAASATEENKNHD